MHPGMIAPQSMMPPVIPQSTASTGPRKESIVDKLVSFKLISSEGNSSVRSSLQVGPPTAANPPRVMPERRMFFERLVQFCEQHGEPITMIPQVRAPRYYHNLNWIDPEFRLHLGLETER